MAITAPVTLQKIVAEFGGTPPVNLSDYASYIGKGPSDPVYLSDFEGASAQVPVTLDLFFGGFTYLDNTVDGPIEAQTRFYFRADKTVDIDYAYATDITSNNVFITAGEMSDIEVRVTAGAPTSQQIDIGATAQTVQSAGMVFDTWVNLSTLVDDYFGVIAFYGGANGSKGSITVPYTVEFRRADDQAPLGTANFSLAAEAEKGGL